MPIPLDEGRRTYFFFADIEPLAIGPRMATRPAKQRETLAVLNRSRRMPAAAAAVGSVDVGGRSVDVARTPIVAGNGNGTGRRAGKYAEPL
jgi:hypothetical protein